MFTLLLQGGVSCGKSYRASSCQLGAENEEVEIHVSECRLEMKLIYM
jgi:hypothetical protein